jgi:hypothetical protein
MLIKPVKDLIGPSQSGQAIVSLQSVQ